jgi:signal transduction histidine kinase
MNRLRALGGRLSLPGWLLPQKVRARLTLAYAALFLAAGAILLAVTYGLLAASLPDRPGPAIPKAENAKIMAACKEQLSNVSPAKCQRAAQLGLQEQAASQKDQTLQRLLLFSLAGLGLMTVASGGLGWLMAGRVLRPVRSITETARRASRQQLGERIGLSGPRDELRELADTFDQMLENLDGAFASQRRFVADASHELRTPLTVMRTAIEVTLAKPNRTPQQLEAMAAKVARSAAQAEALIEALLTLAVSEQEPATREVVDLATAAEDALDAAASRIRAAGLTVHADLETAETTGSRLLLDRLVGNLVDNAVRHNLTGGWIRARTWASDGTACFDIASSGAPVPAQILPALFQPFRRVAERTSHSDGAGLGLAIVASITQAHHGSVQAREITPGGLGISVTLPAAQATDAETALPASQGKGPPPVSRFLEKRGMRPGSGPAAGLPG